jgi:hypothetical protein
MLIGFEVFTAAVAKIAIFCDIVPCSPYMNRRFRGTFRLRLKGQKSAEQETSVRAGGHAE